MSVQCFGDFVEPDNGFESIQINFVITPSVRQKRWQNGGLSTGFLLEYWNTFFPLYDQYTLNQKSEIEYTLRFIANELLENVLRHGATDDQHPARFSLFMSSDELNFYISNSVTLEDVSKFQERIHKLLTEDPSELYVLQMESTMEEGNTVSGMGFLTMLNDYDAKIAWKFENLPQPSALMSVTTMVVVPI